MSAGTPTLKASARFIDEPLVKALCHKPMVGKRLELGSPVTTATLPRKKSVKVNGLFRLTPPFPDHTRNRPTGRVASALNIVEQ